MDTVPTILKTADPQPDKTDPTTGQLLRDILKVEEKHADELADLLVGLPQAVWSRPHLDRCGYVWQRTDPLLCASENICQSAQGPCALAAISKRATACNIHSSRP